MFKTRHNDRRHSELDRCAPPSRRQEMKRTLLFAGALLTALLAVAPAAASAATPAASTPSVIKVKPHCWHLQRGFGHDIYCIYGLQLRIPFDVANSQLLQNGTGTWGSVTCTSTTERTWQWQVGGGVSGGIHFLFVDIGGHVDGGVQKTASVTHQSSITVPIPPHSARRCQWGAAVVHFRGVMTHQWCPNESQRRPCTPLQTNKFHGSTPREAAARIMPVRR